MFEADLYHQEFLNLEGSSVFREAVRAVIRQGREVLFIHSTVKGDYKFPGGGIEEGEDHEAALRREVQEECGFRLDRIGEKIAVINEYAAAKEENVDFFRMESHYYECTCHSGVPHPQNLDDYEKELGMKPVWLDLNKALQINRTILEQGGSCPPWLKREILFQEFLQKNGT